jgi:hypothetical protein
MEYFLTKNYKYLAEMKQQLRHQIALLHLVEKNDVITRQYIKHNIKYLLHSIESTQVIISWAQDFPADVNAFVSEV